MQPVSCIYCSSSTVWSEEHCLPRGLGKFRGYHSLESTICKECNLSISKAEEQFLRASPEAFYRHFLDIKGRKHHKGVSPFYRGSSGAPALIIKFPPPGSTFDVLWEVIPGTNDLRELRQIIMRIENGETFPIAIPPEISSTNELRNHLEKCQIETAKPIAFFDSDEQFGELAKMIIEIWPKKRTSGVIAPQGLGKIPIAIKVTVTSLYFRAIAKIGFHYFLSVFSGQFSGGEPEFAPIRSFIMEGKGNVKDFVIQVPLQMVYGLLKGFSTKVWGHFLTAEKTTDKVFSRVQFFVGPQNLPAVLQIKIGPNPLRIIHSEAHGHFYHYYPGGLKDGYDGEVSEMRSANREFLL